MQSVPGSSVKSPATSVSEAGFGFPPQPAPAEPKSETAQQKDAASPPPMTDLLPNPPKPENPKPEEKKAAQKEEKPVLPVQAMVEPHPDAATPMIAKEFTPPAETVQKKDAAKPPLVKKPASVIWEDISTVLEQPIRYD